MSAFTDYFEEEFEISLKEEEVICLSENSFPGNEDIELSGGICAGLSINWIVSRLSSQKFRIGFVEAEEGRVKGVSSFERTAAGMVQKFYLSKGASKFNKYRDQKFTDYKTLNSIFKSKTNKTVLNAPQCSVDDSGFWGNITNLNGIYYISAKGNRRGHAMAADLRGPTFQFYEPGQFWLKFDSSERFAEILKGLVEKGSGGAEACLDYETWGWYEIV